MRVRVIRHVDVPDTATGWGLYGDPALTQHIAMALAHCLRGNVEMGKPEGEVRAHVESMMRSFANYGADERASKLVLADCLRRIYHPELAAQLAW